MYTFLFLLKNILIIHHHHHLRCCCCCLCHRRQQCRRVLHLMGFSSYPRTKVKNRSIVLCFWWNSWTGQTLLDLNSCNYLFDHFYFYDSSNLNSLVATRLTIISTARSHSQYNHILTDTITWTIFVINEINCD